MPVHISGPPLGASTSHTICVGIHLNYRAANFIHNFARCRVGAEIDVVGNAVIDGVDKQLDIRAFIITYIPELTIRSRTRQYCLGRVTPDQ